MLLKFLGIFRPLVLWRFTSLVQALDDDDEIVRLTVLNTLNNLGSAAAPATPALVKILADSDDIIERGIVAEVLGSIGPAAEEAVPQLLKCLEEPGDSAARVYFRLKVAVPCGGSRENQITFWKWGAKRSEVLSGGCGGKERITGRAWELLGVWPFLNFADWWTMSTQLCEGRQRSRWGRSRPQRDSESFSIHFPFPHLLLLTMRTSGTVGSHFPQDLTLVFG